MNYGRNSFNHITYPLICMKTVLYTAANITVSYDPDSLILVNDWRGPQTNELIVSSGGVILSLFKEQNKQGCVKVLNDNTLKVGPWVDSIQYATQTWFPKMMDAGLRQFAWVFSEDFFTELTAKEIISQINTIAIAKPFTSRQEAHEWLLTQDNSSRVEILKKRNGH